MGHGRFGTLAAALLLAVGVCLPMAAAGGETDIIEQVRTAKTSADHQAIAGYYDAQAAAAKGKAAEHRKMAATYTAGGSIGKGAGPIPLPQHCQTLAKDYDEQASHFTSMADTHRELAKAAK